jgi:cytochrome P450
MINPPTHTRLRGRLTKAFNARQMGKLKEIVETTVDRLIERLAAKREIDLMIEYGMPLPVEIICDLLDSDRAWHSARRCRESSGCCR